MARGMREARGKSFANPGLHARRLRAVRPGITPGPWSCALGSRSSRLTSSHLPASGNSHAGITHRSRRGNNAAGASFS